MGTEVNKDVIKQWLLALCEGRIEDAKKLFTEDASWWVVDAGYVDMGYVTGFWEQGFSSAPGADIIEIVSMTAEDDRIAFETTLKLKLPDGRDYNNRFHMLFRVRDGRIYEAREYLDSAYTRDVLGSQSDHEAVLADRRLKGVAS